MKRMEREIRSIYRKANTEATRNMQSYLKQFEKKDAKYKESVKKGKMTRTEYKQWRKQEVMTGKKWKKMVEQTAKDMNNANKIAARYVNNRLPKIYEINYNGEAKFAEIKLKHKAIIKTVDQQKIKNLISAGNKSLLPQKVIDPKKDIPWNMQRVNSVVLQGVIQDDDINKIAKRISRVTGANEAESIRAARTIVTRVENQAVNDVAGRLSKKGFIVTKSWVAMNDNKTRDWHSDADATYGSEENSIPWDEPFEVGGEELMYPGEGGPANAYNCRCTTVNWYQGFDEKKLRGRDVDEIVVEWEDDYAEKEEA